MGKIFLNGGKCTQYKELRDFFSSSKKIVLLTDGLKDENYFKEWKNEIKNIEIISPKTKNDIDSNLIENSDGIIIGGGKMRVYNDLYNNEKIKEIIVKKHKSGVNIAGISAGSMILGEYFWLDGIFTEKGGEKIKLSEKMGENYKGDFLIEKGFGIIKDKIIGVHIKEHDEMFATKEVILKSGLNYGIGLDEDTTVIIEKGKIIDSFGKGEVYEIKN